MLKPPENLSLTLSSDGGAAIALGAALWISSSSG
jgi:hypothetical protein